jgi:hypothetical protein
VQHERHEYLAVLHPVGESVRQRYKFPFLTYTSAYFITVYHKSIWFLKQSIIFESWIRIRIRTKVKLKKLKRPKIEPLRAVDAHNGGLEAQTGAREGLQTSGHTFASLRLGARSRSGFK